MKRSADERRSEGMSGAELVTTIGLVLYASVASLGLFINEGFSNPLLALWLSGFVLLLLTLSYNSYVSPKPLNKFSFVILGAITLNLLVQVGGGVNSFLWSVYFPYAALIAAFSPPRWTYALVGFILFIETANLVVPKGHGAVPWGTFTGFALSLACVSGAVTLFRSRERKIREERDRLIAHAEAIDPLSDESKLAALTQDSRKAANVNAALERQSAFDGLVEIIDRTVHAHTYALILVEPAGKGEALILRAIRSGSMAATSSVGDVLATFSETSAHPSIIAACARDKRIYYYPELSFPPMNLGYYRAGAKVRSFLALPIVQEGKTIGVLAVDSLEGDAFPAATQEILVGSAPVFVQIIRNIQTSQDLDIKASYFRALHEMSVVLNSSLEMEDLLGGLTARINETAPYDLCVFVRYDEETREAVVIHRSGSAAAPDSGAGAPGGVVASLKALLVGSEDARPEGRFPVAESGILGRMLKEQESGRASRYHFPDFGDRGEAVGLFGDAVKIRQRLRTLACWPLTAGDKFVGACFLGSTRPDAFSELQIGVLDTLMNQVAVVMENTLLHRQMSERALTDGLTGLLNHRTFMERLIDEFNRLDREPQPFSLLLLDIDHFKKVNDAYGHPVGDVALKTVAGIVKKSVRAIDYVARYGGEEFAVGLVGADGKGAEQMAERIRKTLENTPITAGRNTFSCTLSIGTATLKVGTERKEDLIGRADEALYHAKRTGRNRVCLHERLAKAEREASARSAGPDFPADP